ncbi:MAG TPA: hypothetical protein VEX39_02820 [Thermoleophilaceae bacterium]|nr:hypothetical protein [Thermoleophilaceae bacterium]
MALSLTHSEELRTRGAQVLAGFLPLHEEHAPEGFGTRAEDAVLRVGGHVGDAARLAGDQDGCASVLVAVPLTWAAATALAAIPRLRDAEGGIAAKDALLAQVDRAVAARPAAGAEGAAPAELVAAVAAPLGSALGFLVEPDGDEDAAGALFELVVAAVAAVELLERAG